MLMLLNKIQVLAQAHFNSRSANPPKRHLRRLRRQEAFGRRERKDHSSVECHLGSCSFSSPQAAKRASILLVHSNYMFLRSSLAWSCNWNATGHLVQHFSHHFLRLWTQCWGFAFKVNPFFSGTKVPFMMVLLLNQKVVPQHVHSNLAFLTKANHSISVTSTKNYCSQKSYVSEVCC